MPSIIVPDAVRAQFPALIQLIEMSESMNDEERQYWVNILPIMTPEQSDNLRDILENEKKQLQRIDEKYANQIQKIGSDELVRKTTSERRSKREQREQSERKGEEGAHSALESVLEQIDSL